MPSKECKRRKQMDSQKTPSINELWRIVQDQGSTIRSQSARMDAQATELERLRPDSSGRPSEKSHLRQGGRPEGKISRAGLLKAAAVGAVATTVVAGSELVSGSKPALADGTEGQTEFTSDASPTVLILNTNPSGIGLEMIGPVGEVSEFQNIYTKVEEGRAMVAISAHGTAIEADATTGNGVNATSLSGVGLIADGGSGRGVVSSGDTAPVRLVPSTRPSHPHAGLAGDLFVDSKRRLWFCTVGGSPAKWRRVRLV
jgi:hypothetical protein